MNKIPSLDGLRAGSILVVFVAHSPLAYRIPVGGDTGVTVFFFLSGFLITTLLRREQDLYGSIDLKAFYLRRSLRILPVLYLVLTVALVLGLAGVLAGHVTFGGALAQYLHLTNYYVVTQGASGLVPSTTSLWSLAVEEHFYLLFPVALVLLSRRLSGRRAQALALLSVCVVISAWRVGLVYSGHADFHRAYLSTDTRADSLLFGCALALGFNPSLDDIPGPTWLWTWLLTPLSLVALLATSSYGDPKYVDSLRFTFQGLILGVIFVCAIRAPRWGPWRILNWRPVAFLGVLSYSFYIVHQPVIGLLEQHTTLSKYPLSAIALVLSTCIAYVLYRAVELPTARLRRKLSRTDVRAPAVIQLPEPDRVSEARVGASAG